MDRDASGMRLCMLEIMSSVWIRVWEVNIKPWSRSNVALEHGVEAPTICSLPCVCPGYPC